MNSIYLSNFLDSGHDLDIVSPRLGGPLVLAQPEQAAGAGQVGGHRVAEVIQDVAQVGDVHRQLLGAPCVEAGDGGHVGEVGGARGGGQAA